MYNLELFGKSMKSIRESVSFTQKRMSELSHVDEKTLRRIEKGLVVPKIETLDLLSPFYKIDLYAYLMEFRIDDYSYYNDITTKIDLKNPQHGCYVFKE